MKTDTKKPKVTITLEPIIAEKVKAEADARHGGNFSRAINESLRNWFIGDQYAQESAARDEVLDENDRFKSMLLRMKAEGILPKWVTVETGDIRFGEKSYPCVRNWKMEPSEYSYSTHKIVEALKEWIGDRHRNSTEKPKSKNP